METELINILNGRQSPKPLKKQIIDIITATKTFEIYCGPTPIDELIQFLKEQKENGATAVNIISDDCYEGPCDVTIETFYSRLENNTEFEMRIEEERQKEEQKKIREQEHQQYLALKKKFKY